MQEQKQAQVAPGEQGTQAGLTRRAMMRGALKAGVYAAPVILATTTVATAVAAASLPGTVIAFLQDTGITAVGALAPFDVSFTPLNGAGQPVAPTAFLGSFTTDRFGVGGMPFPLTLDTSVVKAVQLTYTFHTTPTPPAAASFTSNLVAAVAPVNGVRPAGQMLGLVVQEPTVAACQTGPLTQYTETIDVALVNVLANTAYDFYVQTNGVGAAVKVGTATTNGQGNSAVFMASPAVTAASVPTSVVVSVVRAGAALSPALYTLVASGGSLVTIDCGSLQAAHESTSRSGKALGIAVH